MWSMLIGGLLAGGGVVALVLWLRNRNISFTWYEWLIGILGFLMLVFTFQSFFSSFAENEPGAGWLILLIMGLPSLILLGVAWQLAARRQRAQS